MKKYLKVVALALCTVMTISVTGCQKVNENEVTKVSVWTNSTSTKELAEQLVNEYNQTIGKKDGIEIEYKVFGSDYQNILDVAIQSNDLPDLFSPISNIKDMVIKEALTPIEQMPGGDKFIEKYGSKIMPIRHSYMGNTYCVPYKLTTIGLIYNKDLFKANGIVDENGEAKAPKTWDEVAEYAKICTDKANNVYGIALPLKWGGYTSWDLLQPFFSSLGSVGYDYDAGKFDYTVLKPAFEWLMRIKADESYFIGAEGLDNDPARARFAEGNVAMKLGASWDVGVLNDQYPATCDWGVAEVPTIDGVAKYKQWSGADPLLVISSSIDEDKKEKIMKVYEWFHNEENQKTMYEKGKYIPADASVITEDVEFTAKNWVEFAKMADVSVITPVHPVVSIEGDTISKVMLKIWMGDVDIDEALADITERANKALEKEKERGTLGDMSAYTWGDIEHTIN